MKRLSTLLLAVLIGTSQVLAGNFVMPGEQATQSLKAGIAALAPATSDPAALIKRLTANAGATNGTSAQPWFPTAGAVTVAAGTLYKFRGLLALSVTNGSINLSTAFAGTATLTNISYVATAAVASGSAPVETFVATAAAAIVATGVTAAGPVPVLIEGTLLVNAGGTLIPQFKWSGTPGTNSVLLGTYFELIAVTNNPNGTWQ